MEVRSLNLGEGREGFALSDSRLGIRLIAARDSSSGNVIAPLDFTSFDIHSPLVEERLHWRLDGYRQSAATVFDLVPRLGAAILAPSPHGEWLPKALDALASFFVDHGFRLAPGFGCRKKDLQTMSALGAPVIGLSAAADHGHGATLRAYSVVSCLEALVEHLLRQVDFHDVRIAIVGIDDAGEVLAKKLAESGARLYLADQNSARLRALASRLGAVSVDVADLSSLACHSMIFTDPWLEALAFQSGRMRARSLIGDFGEFLVDPDRRRVALDGTPWIVPGWVGGAGSWIGLDAEANPKNVNQRAEDETLIRIRALKTKVQSWIRESESRSISLVDYAINIQESVKL